MKPSHHTGVTYRPEIDGLRAVAVVPVILFHAGFKFFSGGFVGVDVFFVISGYLITSIILTDLLAGRFSIKIFYDRRARRILPPLFLVLACSIPAAWFWLDAPDFRAFSKSLVAVSTFSSNILFWRETGYFDTTAELKPLLHTWTLAVEEQYYLLFPLLMMAAWKLGKTRTLFLLCGIAIASLIYAQMGAQADSTAAFYLLPTRAWELMVGSIIAVRFLRRSPINVAVTEKSNWLNELASLAGLMLIGCALILFDEGTVYPGTNALLPTLGAALILVHANGSTLVGRLLSTRAFISIGMISYSAYLWHQPLFAFARNVSITEPAEATMLALTTLSLSLAYASWRYIERPFRNKVLIGPKPFYSIMTLATLLVVIIGVSGVFTNGFKDRFSEDPLMAGSFIEPTLRQRCDQGYDGRGWGIGFCTFGDPDRALTPEVAVFGDSHAEALLPAFDQAGKKVGQSIVEIGLGGCPPLIGIDVIDSPYEPGVCTDLASREVQYVKEHHIEKVFLVSRWTLYTDTDMNKERKTDAFLISSNLRDRTQDNSRKVFEQALATTLQAYRDAGATVFVVAQVPQQLVTPKNIYYRLSRDKGLNSEEKLELIKEVSVPSEKNAAIQQFSRAIFEKQAARKRMNLVVLDNEFCDAKVCLLGDTQSYYKDYNHLNTYGAQHVSAKVAELLLKNI
jgi:peptidoglycan/LPS O-acetylase OafA/YrhL